MVAGSWYRGTHIAAFVAALGLSSACSETSETDPATGGATGSGATTLGRSGGAGNVGGHLAGTAGASGGVAGATSGTGGALAGSTGSSGTGAASGVGGAGGDSGSGGSGGAAAGSAGSGGAAGDGLGGTAGAAEGGEGGGAGSAGTGGCVDLTHVLMDMPRGDLTVVGSGFDEYEGYLARTVVTERDPNYGLGETVIENGAFEILLPGTLGHYTGIAFYIDQDGDKICDPTEEFFRQWTIGPGAPDFVWDVSPETMVSPASELCQLAARFDLREPLACPADP